MTPTRTWAGQGVRFLLAGAGNTLATLALYQLLLLVLAPPPAYALTWVVGLMLVAILYPTRVFEVGRPTRATRAGVVLVYVAGFAIGIVAIGPATGLLGRRTGILPVIALTTVFNFVAMKLVIARTEGRRTV